MDEIKGEKAMFGKSVKVAMVFSLLGVFCLQGGAEEGKTYSSDYSKEPVFKIYYGSYKSTEYPTEWAEKKQPIDVHEVLPFKIDGNSYCQEFDIGFTNVQMYGHWFVGLYKGFRIFFTYGEKGKRIYLHHPSGDYVAKFEQGTFKAGDVYHVKIIYNGKKLTSQCIVTDKQTGTLIWDSGENVGEGIYPDNVYFSVGCKAGPPYSSVKWDQANQRINLLSTPVPNYKFEGWVDNMKVELLEK